MLAPGTAIGRYQIKRKLAEGGMAEIYLASALGPEGFAKDVVIKVVRSFLTTDRQFIDMFIAEARLASKLNHGNIVQIFDFGKHEESYYLAMEYVRGASLWELRRRCRERSVPMHPVLVAEIGAQVARGLHYAHTLSDKGQPLAVVHRDVTPHNVLLSFDGGVKLTDFGIAKASTSHTAPGMLKGKFAYMSPEQARGESVDQRTDVFALGIVLWELATGGRLFEAENDVAVLRAVQESAIAPPHRLNPDVPHELSAIIMKALARALPERFSTAWELERALSLFVLRSSQAVEDTSVAFFMQQLFREEFEASQRDGGTPAVGVAAVKREALNDRTSSMPESSMLGETLSVDRVAEHLSKTPHAQQTVTAQGAETQRQRGGVVPKTYSFSEENDELKTAELGEPSKPGKPKTEQMRGVARITGSLPDAPLNVGAKLQSRKLPPVPAAPVEAQPQTVSSAQVVVQRDTASLTSPEEAVVSAPRPRRPWVLAGVMLAAAVAVVAVAMTQRETAAQGRADVGAPVALTSVTPAEAPRAAHQELPRALPVAVERAAAEPPMVTPEPASLDAGPAVASVDAAPAAPAAVVAEAHAVVPLTQSPKALSAAVAVTSPAPVVPVPSAAGVQTGMVEIHAVPFARLMLNGRPAGEVQGLRQVALKPGTWEVWLDHPKKRTVLNVSVAAGKTQKVDFNALTP